MSEASVLNDRSGVPFYYGAAADDCWFPPFPLPYPYSQQLDVIKKAVIRDDDVIMTGYGKSGELKNNSNQFIMFEKKLQEQRQGDLG